MAIDIGADAIDRNTNFVYGQTIVALDNPANESGTIATIELFASTTLSNCKVGTFSRDGNNFTCHDYDTIGDVEAGNKQSFPVSIACTIGDYIGIHFSAGNIKRDISGYLGIYTKNGDQFEAGEQTYTIQADNAISVYGTSIGYISYHFNSKSTSVWTDPEKMIDNILTNYAYTSSDGAMEVLDGNNGPGTNLGTITKVEIRAYGYGDGNDRIDVTPVFGGSSDGDTHQTTPGVSPGSWGIYQDITNDTNHPSPWAWSDVQAIDCKVIKLNVSKGNVMYCAKVEIIVTFTPPGGGVAISQGYIF